VAECDRRRMAMLIWWDGRLRSPRRNGGMCVSGRDDRLTTSRSPGALTVVLGPTEGAEGRISDVLRQSTPPELPFP
jgi:hypothetical protein